MLWAKEKHVGMSRSQSLRKLLIVVLVALCMRRHDQLWREHVDSIESPLGKSESVVNVTAGRVDKREVNLAYRRSD
jgi:hypothetical protein